MLPRAHDTLPGRSRIADVPRVLHRTPGLKSSGRLKADEMAVSSAFRALVAWRCR